ncbi:MAG: CPBP family intramembrane metalloprotease [Treponema sp.]|jgi:membrane protease YdiL (CAAX protease family)|nr:CPBP family intramembrane metalloprotease [Treponema sp.]
MPIIEAIILYFVLFFPSVFSSVEGGSAIAFSINHALSRIFIYNAPPVALIWFLVLRKKQTATPAKRRLFSPAPRNLASLNPMGLSHMDSFMFNAGNFLATFILALSGLILINISASLANGLVERITGGGFGADFGVQTPDTAAGWFVLCLLCLSAAYLEESFFRFYLSDRLKEFGFYPAMLISSVSFAYCHLYEGVFGVVNALLAGLFLFFIFKKRKSGNGMRTLHALAFAHGVYNALVYAAIALNL